MAQPKQQFKEQGGVATMDPSPIRRWIISKVMSLQASQKRMNAKRDKAERHRLKMKQPHVVEYFHQIDDGYSHLAAQVLTSFLARYDVELHVHLVSAPTGLNVAEPELLMNLGVSDAKSIAPHYGLAFPEHSALPSPENVALAHSILAAQSSFQMVECIASISTALWQNDAAALTKLATQYGAVDPQLVKEKLTQGNLKRKSLQHYSGAMFFYAGEWYWGVDRFYHLEQRLRSLGADKNANQPLILPRPEMLVGGKKDTGTLTLEIYASLRSPYTAIAFDRAVQLAKDTGINCVIRPILPMVMRGVPASKEKGLYILFDTAREARAAGVPYGNVCDPIGQPARHGYALYQWACKFNKGTEFISYFLRAAFAEGINTNKNSGLRHVVESTGLDWQLAKKQISDDSWHQELEDNRLTMYESGIWGVPSFRLLDQNGKELLARWGQDRLWLFAWEIQRLLNR